MELQTVTKQLKAGNTEPVYIIHGQERFLIAEFLTKVRGIVAVGPMADFNYSRKKMSETSGAQLVADAKSMPMMAAQRLIIIDDFDKVRASDTQAIDEYLAKPVPETCLVLVGSKFDLRKGMFKRANGRKQVHKADPLSERDILQFIKQRARKRKVKLQQGADAAICAAVGADCSALDDAVERLALYCGGEEVCVEDVENVVSSVRQHSVFELVDALGNRRQAQVFSLLEELFSEREEPLKLNFMLSRHMRHLLWVKVLSFHRVDPGHIAKQIGVPPFVAKKLSAQSKGFSGRQLESALLRLAKVDFEMKSSRRPSNIILEDALMDLCLG